MTKYLTPIKILKAEQYKEAKGTRENPIVDRIQLLKDIQFQLKQDTGFKLPLVVLLPFIKTYMEKLGDIVSSGGYVNLGENLPYLKVTKIYIRKSNTVDWEKSLAYRKELIDKGISVRSKTNTTGENWLIFSDYVGDFQYIKLVHRKKSFSEFTKCYYLHLDVKNDSRKNPLSMKAKFNRQKRIGSLVFA